MKDLNRAKRILARSRTFAFAIPAIFGNFGIFGISLTRPHPAPS
jgi:hypothetical protein